MTAKLSFRKWLDLENTKKLITKETESSGFPDRVFAYLSVAFDFVDETASWENSVFSFMQALHDFQPNGDLPLIKDAPKEEAKPAAWDYENRTWAYWSHLLAKTYGWTLEYIADMDVNEALARVQEILTDEHLEKEFAHGLSEISYPYNSSTKKSVYKPMPRPYWMKPKVAPLKMTKFKASMMPVGAIQDLSGMPDEYNPLRDYVTKPAKNIQKTEANETNASPSP